MLTDMSIQLSVVACAGAIIINTAAWLFWHTTDDFGPGDGADRISRREADPKVA